MPQLDKFAFAPQVFWLVFFFFAVYLFLLRDSLNTLYRVLNFRKKLVHLLNVTAARYSTESTFLISTTSRFLLAFLLTKMSGEVIFRSTEAFLLKPTSAYNLLCFTRHGLCSETLELRLVCLRQGTLTTTEDSSSLLPI